MSLPVNTDRNCDCGCQATNRIGAAIVIAAMRDRSAIWRRHQSTNAAKSTNSTVKPGIMNRSQYQPSNVR